MASPVDLLLPRTSRTIILLFDGTSNQFDTTNTNIVKLCEFLKTDEPARQLVYYQAGIGTYTGRMNSNSSVMSWFNRQLDKLTASFLDVHICDGYEYLMNNYLPDDKVLIFGFSRGAYTARALAGMIHKVGLLTKDNQEQVHFAFQMYKKQKDAMAAHFKRTFCQDIKINFLGLWDTVSSVGLLYPRHLPFTSNNTVNLMRHAISLDERRTKFNVALWQPENERLPQEAAREKGILPVKEMWFPGCHSDVGGGAEPNGTTPCLANISLRWMLHEVFEADLGVLFVPGALARHGIPRDCLPHRGDVSDDLTRYTDEKHPPHKGNQHQRLLTHVKADEEDAAAKINDRLKKKPMYWLVQWPVWRDGKPHFSGRRMFPRADDKDEVMDDFQFIHRSVAMRVKHDPSYEPRAHLTKNWRDHVAD